MRRLVLRLGTQFIRGLQVVRACHRRLHGAFALAWSRQRLKPLFGFNAASQEGNGICYSMP